MIYKDPKWELVEFGQINKGTIFYLPSFQLGAPMSPSVRMKKVSNTKAKKMIPTGGGYFVCEDEMSSWDDDYPVFVWRK